MNAASKNEGRVQRLRERLREATAATILTAAEEAFATHGLRAARMEDIALGAGVSVGTLYNYFADRGALLGALLDSRRAEMMSRLDSALARGEQLSFEAQLSLLLTALFEDFEAHRRFMSILMEGELARDPETASVTGPPRETMRAVYARLEQLIQRGVDSGALQFGPARLYPAILMGMLRGVLIRTLFEKSPQVDLRHSVPELVDFFLRGAARRD